MKAIIQQIEHFGIRARTGLTIPYLRAVLMVAFKTLFVTVLRVHKRATLAQPITRHQDFCAVRHQFAHTQCGI